MQPESTNGCLQTRLASVAAFCWPFLYLFPYVFTAEGRYLGIGNDFQILYFSYKAYLLDALSNWNLPLWSPSEAGGFPFYASPFTQTFYPLNIPLAVYYKLAGGYAPIDHQRYAVLGISIFSLGIFRWLLSLRLSMRAALFATLVMSVSFKVTEILRFPNALHTAAWYPWVLLFITRIVESRSSKARVTNGLLLTCALICMVTGGYPYYLYYSQWLLGPYLAMLLVPQWSRVLLAREPENLKAALVTLGVVGLVALASCGPYLYKTSVLMQQTTDRAGQSFAYSTAHVFNHMDTIGSWLFPPASQMEGWYYFGMIGVLLVLLYLMGPWRPLKLILVSWIGLITYITYGKSSYLFVLLWHYAPSFSSLRVWGRMNIILVPILAWALAAAYQHFESLLDQRGTNRVTPRGLANGRPFVVLSIIFAALLTVQLYLWSGRQHDISWTAHYAGGILRQGQTAALVEYLRHVGLRTSLTPQALVAYAEGAALVSGGIAFALLSLLLALRSRLAFDQSRVKGYVLGVVLVVATLDVWLVGPWAWASGVASTSRRTPLDVSLRNAESFGVPRIDGKGISPTAAFHVGVLDNWYFQRYVDFLREGKEDSEATQRLLGLVDGRKLFFSEVIDHRSVRAFLDDAVRFPAVESVSRYTGDELHLVVRAPIDGYLSFIDNWDADWEASVDGKSVPIERLFGTFKSVRVAEGMHAVKFFYRPLRLWKRGQN